MNIVRKGFTLVELLLVIGVIAVLSSVAVMAVSPQKVLTKATDTKRTLASREIKNALIQDQIDKKGAFLHSELIPNGEENAKEVCRPGLIDPLYCINLDELVPTYIQKILIDKSSENPVTAGYKIYKENGTIQVKSSNLGKLGKIEYRYQDLTSTSSTLSSTKILDINDFVIGTNYFLTIANYINGNSTIYKWDGTQYASLQTIAGTKPWEWNHFKLDNEHYLAMINKEGSNKIYKWNGSQFVLENSISGNKHSSSSEFFTIEGEHYLMVNWRYGGTSPLYKWDGEKFDHPHYQLMPTNGLDAEFITLNKNHYLIIGAEFGDSKVYKFNTTTKLFEIHQNLSLDQVYDFELFEDDGEAYLLSAEWPTGPSRVHKWDGNEFDLVQSLTGKNGLHWETLLIGDEKYFILSSNSPAAYKIFQWNNEQLTEVDSIATTSSPWSTNVVTINGQYYFIGGDGADGEVYTIDMNN